MILPYDMLFALTRLRSYCYCISCRAEISSAVSVAKGVEPLRDYTSLNAVAAPGSGADVVDQSVINPDKRLTQEWKASGNDPTVGFDDGPNRSWNWAPCVRVSGMYTAQRRRRWRSHVGSGFVADAAKVVARNMLVKVTNRPVQKTRYNPSFSGRDI